MTRHQLDGTKHLCVHYLFKVFTYW